MPRLIYTPRARQDLIWLHSFIAEKNLQAAQRVAKAILESAGLLRRNPKIGRPVAELPPDFRELVIPFGAAGYLLRYRIVEEQDEVVILAVRHQREAGYEILGSCPSHGGIELLGRLNLITAHLHACERG